MYCSESNRNDLLGNVPELVLAFAGTQGGKSRHHLDGFHYLYRFAAEGRIFGDCPLKPRWHPLSWCRTS